LCLACQQKQEQEQQDQEEGQQQEEVQQKDQHDGDQRHDNDGEHTQAETAVIEVEGEDGMIEGREDDIANGV
jgi:ABC-type Zn2+ transport system substrate-binding protein/surface adhesin